MLLYGLQKGSSPIGTQIKMPRTELLHAAWLVYWLFIIIAWSMPRVNVMPLSVLLIVHSTSVQQVVSKYSAQFTGNGANVYWFIQNVVFTILKLLWTEATERLSD